MISACVIGWPVSHSRSPLIHGHWLTKYAIRGSYVRRPVPPDGLHAFLRSMQKEGFAGCNVTLPHKQDAFRAADTTMPAARAVAAANTLWLEDGRLVADNTDGAGFLAHARSRVPGFPIPGRPVLVLGAGGAARAIIHALRACGVDEVRIANRTARRAVEVADHFGTGVTVAAWEERTRCARGAAALVNATSLGMAGNAGLAFDVASLDADCIVADIVYVPLLTPLLAAAQARGLATIDGLGMLMHQAVPGFQRWFGVLPEVTDELRAVLVADLEAR
jgi:shikimate dehydrogenase